MESTEDEFYSICLNLTSEEIASLGGCNYSAEFENGELLEKVVSRVVPIFFGFIGIVGLVGNALVVLVVAANPGMRSTTNLLIINLAVADLLFVIFCVPFTATDYVMPRWPFGDWWCKVVQYFIVVTAHASVYTLVLMSLDRFMAVVHPIASMSIRTEKNALLAIACIWVVILTTAIPVGICHGEREYSYFHRNHSSCVFLEEQGYSKLGFQMSFFLSSYVIPLTLISVLYMCMLTRLWKSAPGGRVSAESRRGRKKVTRMVVVVVVVFAVCWCPIQIILLVKALDAYNITYFTVTAQIVSHVLAYMNSCVNPVLYAFLSENFRVAFRKGLGCLPYEHSIVLRKDAVPCIDPPRKVPFALVEPLRKELELMEGLGIIQKVHEPTLWVMYCPPPYSEAMGRPQPTKTTRAGNGNSCHDIV